MLSSLFHDFCYPGKCHKYANSLCSGEYGRLRSTRSSSSFEIGKDAEGEISPARRNQLKKLEEEINDWVIENFVALKKYPKHSNGKVQLYMFVMERRLNHWFIRCDGKNRESLASLTILTFYLVVDSPMRKKKFKILRIRRCVLLMARIRNEGSINVNVLLPDWNASGIEWMKQSDIIGSRIYRSHSHLKSRSTR